MKLVKASLSILTAILILSGCLDYKEKMKLNSDLSGEIQFSIGISEQLFNLGSNSPEMKDFNEEKLKENYSKKEGIRFISSRSYSEAGNRWIEVKIAFKDIEHLMNATEDSTQKGLTGQISLIEKDNGEIVFTRNIFENESKKDTTADDLSKGMMNMMFGNFSWKYELIVPGEIISSNADSIVQSTNTVYWSFPLSSLSQQKLMTVTFRADKGSTLIKYISGFVLLGGIVFFFIWLNKSNKRRRSQN